MAYDVSAQIAETNRRLDEVVEHLDGLGARMGAALNTAARRPRRVRRTPQGGWERRFGDAAGRTPEEVRHLLRTRFGHPNKEH